MKNIIKQCRKCGSQNFKSHMTAYPMKLGIRQLNIENVAVRECMDCHDLEPTKAGHKKIARCTEAFMSLLEKASQRK